MKCPKCGSTDVEEVDVEIFEATGMSGAICEGFDGFGLLSALRIAKNGYDKAKLAITGKKRYYCNKCEKEFDK